MLRTGLTAAGLVIVAVVLVAGGRAEPARTAHSCTVLDKQFISLAVLSNTSLTLLGDGYLSGDVGPKDAIAETRADAARLQLTHPNDASLKAAKTMMRGMIIEYGRAIRARWKGGDTGAHMYRSYSLANYVHQVLADAQPVLVKQGCSVAELL